ncbi:MAG: hypothetical protein CVT95_10015 [Bacteroidetes bacterium HGW-Bacteroidetes-12]|nr:MAG: hypothetical protein CVT95_10015 [Bacteroidetes bacterium HGW-Bacteroidetes-12]
MIRNITLIFIFIISPIYYLVGQVDTVIYTENEQLVKEKGQLKDGKRIGIWKIYINSNTTKIDTIKYNNCENLIFVDRIE